MSLQTVPTETRHRRTGRLIKVSTICLQIFYLYLNTNDIKPHKNPLNGNGLVQLIRMANSIQIKGQHFNYTLLLRSLRYSYSYGPTHIILSAKESAGEHKSWSEMAEEETRTPGHAVHMHNKLSLYFQPKSQLGSIRAGVRWQKKRLEHRDMQYTCIINFRLPQEKGIGVCSALKTGPRSAVCNMSGNRCVSGCRSRGPEFDPGPVPYFREIDHEIISTVILLPSAESFKKGCCQLQGK